MFWIKLRMCRRTYQDENLEFTVFLAKRGGREAAYAVSNPACSGTSAKEKAPETGA
jgi:hypothetical protein